MVNRHERSRVEDLRTCQGSAPRELRGRLLRAVAEIGEVDFALFYNLVEVEGRTYVGDWQAVGDDGVCHRILRPYTREPWPGASHLQAKRPDPRATRAFLEWNALMPRHDVESTEFFQRVYAPHHLGDQIRLLVYHGPRFIGWIGGVRRHGAPPFSRRERRRLKELVEVCVDGFTTADLLAKQGQPNEPGYLVVSEQGRVEMVSQTARPWLERPQFLDALREAVSEYAAGRLPTSRAVIREAEARVLRMEGDGQVRYLVHVLPTRTLRLGAASGLPPAERELAQMAVCGATVQQMAQATGRSPETVRSYLRNVYDRMEVASRVELARALDAEELTPRPP